MVGQVIKRILIKYRYRNLLTPRKELNLFDLDAFKKWFGKYNPNVLIIATAKIERIFANLKSTTEFFFKD